MVDKLTSRPVGSDPSWATDSNMVDGGQPWDATPTKVEPGAGKRADGFLPEENPTAQELNQLLGELTSWVQYLSDIRITNWRNVGEPTDADVFFANVVIFDEGRRAFVVVGETGRTVLSEDGEGWDTQAVHVVGNASWATTKPPADTPTHTGAKTLIGASDGNFVNEATGTGALAWNGKALSGTVPESHDGCWDSFNALWIICGESNSLAAFWSSVTPLVTPTAAAAQTISDSAYAEFIACNDSGLTVAVGNTTAPVDVWTSTDGLTWTRSTPTGITTGESVAGLAWDPVRAVFVMLTGRRTYTSTDGVAWTQVQAVQSAAARKSGKLAITGDLYVTCLTNKQGICYSTDGGITWLSVHVSDSNDPDGNTYSEITFSKLRGQFMIMSTGAATSNCAISLAVATPTIDENNDDTTPQLRTL